MSVYRNLSKNCDVLAEICLWSRTQNVDCFSVTIRGPNGEERTAPFVEGTEIRNALRRQSEWWTKLVKADLHADPELATIETRPWEEG